MCLGITQKNEKWLEQEKIKKMPKKIAKTTKKQYFCKTFWQK